ncbi:MAG: hypothetical protein AAF585_11375 [Verrucomicrobiota bacterium]
MQKSAHPTYRYHPDWGYWFRPELNVRFPQDCERRLPAYRLRTNGVGGPSSHELSSESEGKVKALFIGCSFTVGDGVGQHENFVSQLERLRPGIIGHNYALNGSGNCQQLLIHNHFAPLIEPDLFVLSPYTGCVKRTVIRERPTYDPLKNCKVGRPKPFFLLDEKDRLHLGNSPVPKVSEQYSAEAGPAPIHFEIDSDKAPEIAAAAESKRFHAPPPIEEPKTPSYEIYSHPDQLHYRIVKKVLMATILFSKAKRKIIMPLPHVNNLLHPEEEYRHLYEEVAFETGCEFHDVTPDFAPFREEKFESLFLGGDGHYSKRGHEVVARSLSCIL